MPNELGWQEYEDFVSAFGPISRILSEQEGTRFERLSVSERKFLSETVVFLSESIGAVGFKEPEAAYLESWIEEIAHVLGRETGSDLILALHYFPTNYDRSPGVTTHTVLSIVMELKALEKCGYGIHRGTTPWKYIARDLPRVARKLRAILDSGDFGDVVNELFLLLNLVELFVLLNGTSQFASDLTDLLAALASHQSEVMSAFELAPGLQSYLAELSSVVPIPFEVRFPETAPPGRGSAFLALGHLRLGELPTEATLAAASIPNSRHLWWIAQAWARRARGAEIVGVLPFRRYADIGTLFRIVWGELGSQGTPTATPAEVDTVLRMRPSEIKVILCDYFTQHPNVSPPARAALIAERDKPDAGGEIADFNVEVTTVDGPVTVSIPIKSGLETRGRPPGKVELRNLYQFFRPLFDFGLQRTVVFPIVLVPLTLDSTEFMNQVRVQMGIPIHVLDTSFFISFLRRQGELE